MAKNYDEMTFEELLADDGVKLNDAEKKNKIAKLECKHREYIVKLDGMIIEADKANIQAHRDVDSYSIQSILENTEKVTNLKAQRAMAIELYKTKFNKDFVVA